MPLYGMPHATTLSHPPASHALSSSGAGLLANRAAATKHQKYRDLSQSHIFGPVAVESSGVLGEESESFLRDLGKCTRIRSGDPLSYLKICQRISVTIQKFNAVAILGSSINYD